MANMKSWKRVLKKMDTQDSQETYQSFISQAKEIYLVISG